MNARITQSYWNQYRVAPAKPADKPRREKQGFALTLKGLLKPDPVVEKQLTSDHMTVILSNVAFWLGMGVIVSQVLIYFHVITGPVYL